MSQICSLLYCLVFLVISVDYGECHGKVTDAPPSNNASNLISIYDIKVDICYWVLHGRWPHWLSPNQCTFRAEMKIRLFQRPDGTLMNRDELLNVCQNYKAIILNPDTKPMDYEFCWYAKYGLWRQTPLTHVEENIRRHMINEYMYENDQRIPHWKVVRLCPNYHRMECVECPLALENNCYYARHGRWKNKAPSVSQQRRFFYTGGKRIGIRELIKKCPKYFNHHCRLIHYPNCSGNP